MAERPKQRSAICDGDKIKDRSRELGLNQKALAKAAGVSPKTLQRAERGERVRQDIIGNLATALGVQASEIMAAPHRLEAEGGDQQSRSGYQLIRLKRIKSARELAEMIVSTDEVIFESDVEVDEFLAHDISRIMEKIEKVRSGETGLAPRLAAYRGSEWLSLSPDSIKFLGSLQSHIDGLANSALHNAIGIFAGRYRRVEHLVKSNEMSFESSEIPATHTFNEKERLIVRFSQQQVGSFSYEAPSGLTDAQVDTLIDALISEGEDVVDLRLASIFGSSLEDEGEKRRQ